MLLVYRARSELGQDFSLVTEPVDGVGLVSATVSAEVLPTQELSEVETIWGTGIAPQQDWSARLALVNGAGEQVRKVDFSPCSGWPTSEWGENAVARGRASLQVDPFVEGGAYSVTVALLDDQTGLTVGQPALAGRVEVRAPSRASDPPEMEVEAGATFGESLRLLGYDPDLSESRLLLSLHWQALQRMSADFKFFVHLYEPHSGAVVAQADVMPHDRTYPTSWWEAGEVVSDQIMVTLQDVGPGRYQLWVGVYDAQTEERLSISDVPPGFSVSGGRLRLPEVIAR